jgi:hypothetical protein
MIRGYLEMAMLNRELAEKSGPVINEAWVKYA